MDEGTAARDFRILAEAIDARALANPLDQAYTVTVGDLAGPHLEEMARRSFNRAPAFDSSGRVVGLFIPEEVTDGVVDESALHRLDGLLVSGDTDFATVVECLMQEPFLLVLAGRTPVAFLTPADMSSARARSCLYLTLASLEIELAQLARDAFPDQESALGYLEDDRRKETEVLLGKLREEDELLDLVSALQLADLVKILEQTDFRDYCRCRGIRWKDIGKGIGQFRNHVMHVVRDFPYATVAKMPRLRARVVAAQLTAQAAQDFRSEGRVAIPNDSAGESPERRE